MSSSDHLDKVKKLREITGVGFKDCNSALKESNGNIDKSIEYLRIKGISKASKKMERVAKDGLVCVYEDTNKTSILEINCETDFVAKNLEFVNFSEDLSKISFEQKGDLDKLKKTIMKDGNSVDGNLVKLISKIGEKITIRRSKFFAFNNCMNFSYIHAAVKKNIGKLGTVVVIETNEFNDQIKDFGHKLAMHTAASNPQAIDTNNLNESILNKEKEIIREELKNSGKEKNIVEKILKGRIEKFIQENTLLNQTWIMDQKKRVKDVLKDLDTKNSIIIKDFIRFKVGE